MQSLDALGALGRFCAVTRISEQAVRSSCAGQLLSDVPEPKLQRLALELAAHLIQGNASVSCPLCKTQLPTTAVRQSGYGPQQLAVEQHLALLQDVVKHLWQHAVGGWDYGDVSAVGKSFSISASMLGGYFDSECDRALHRRARRGEGGRREVRARPQPSHLRTDAPQLLLAARRLH